MKDKNPEISILDKELPSTKIIMQRLSFSHFLCTYFRMKMPQKIYIIQFQECFFVMSYFTMDKQIYFFPVQCIFFSGNYICFIKNPYTTYSFNDYVQFRYFVSLILFSDFLFFRIYFQIQLILILSYCLVTTMAIFCFLRYQNDQVFLL